jgi:hypothetical protein
MKQDLLVAGCRQLLDADPLQIGDGGTCKSIDPDDPPVEQVRVLIDADFLLLAARPPPRLPRRRAPRVLDPRAVLRRHGGSDNCHAASWKTGHELLDAGVVAPGSRRRPGRNPPLGAAQYAKMAKSQAGVLTDEISLPERTRK